MTMPHLMNCCCIDGPADGWCLNCVKNLWDEKRKLELAFATQNDLKTEGFRESIRSQLIIELSNEIHNLKDSLSGKETVSNDWYERFVEMQKGRDELANKLQEWMDNCSCSENSKIKDAVGSSDPMWLRCPLCRATEKLLK